MREFILNSSRKPEQVSLFDYEPCSVDLKSTDCVRDYANFIIKKHYRKLTGEKLYGDVTVDRYNGSIEVRYSSFRFWSKDTVRNIKNLIDVVIQDKIIGAKVEHEKLQSRKFFVETIKDRFPRIQWDDNGDNGSYGVCMDADVNNVEVSLDSDWEIQITIPSGQRNAYKIIEYLESTNFDESVEQENE